MTMLARKRPILFLENREKTLFWKAIADRMSARGFEVYWIVQNPQFGRTLGANTYFIGFPPRSRLSRDPQIEKHPLLIAERGHKYFQSGTDHYRFYWDRINQLIDIIDPAFVIGESTLLHELITIAICEERNIPFLHPVGERYPNFRFAIFVGALQLPFAESGEALPWDMAIEMAERIATGREIPAYMAKLSEWKKLTRRLYWALTRVTVWFGRLRGEKYNTPSITQKIRLFREKKRNMLRWKSAYSLPVDGESCILYPLQMQPENTIDVWGLPDFDQVEIIEKILAAAPEGVTVALKANPKPYYELSDELIDFAVRSPRVRLLPFDMKMTEAMRYCVGAITITGTVGYEAVFGRGRCISISHPVLAKHFPSFTALSIDAAVKQLLVSGQVGNGSTELGAKLLQILTARSFPGYISDPISDSRCMDAANLDRVAGAILYVINPAKGGAHFFADKTKLSN